MLLSGAGRFIRVKLGIDVYVRLGSPHYISGVVLECSRSVSVIHQLSPIDVAIMLELQVDYKRHIRVCDSQKSLNAMSAYGAIALASRPPDLLLPTSWDLPQPAPGKPATPFRRLVLHHLRLDSARALPGPSILDYTHGVFAAEVEAGRTYPQEADTGPSSEPDNDDAATRTRTYTRAAFEAYFWAADVIVAIGLTDDDAGDGGDRVQVQDGSVETSRAGRSWEDALVGFYYVKPNYPGRSSHVSLFDVLLPPSYPPQLGHTMSWADCTETRDRQYLILVMPCVMFADLQCGLYYSTCSPGIWVRKDFGQVILALRSLAWIQSKRLQSGLRK